MQNLLEAQRKKIILPAIRKLNLLKFKIKGPLVADTLFIKEYKNFDVIVGMYHDQVLAPLKLFSNFMQLMLLWDLNI